MNGMFCAIAINSPDTLSDAYFRKKIVQYKTRAKVLFLNDTAVVENMAFPNMLSDLKLQAYLKTHNSILKSVVDFENTNGLCYRISNLLVISCLQNYICIYYINAAWDRSRSLVYVVYNKAGDELFSEILSTEDSLLNGYEGYYKQAALSIKKNILLLEVLNHNFFYDGEIEYVERNRYEINRKGIINKL